MLTALLWLYLHLAADGEEHSLSCGLRRSVIDYADRERDIIGNFVFNFAPSAVRDGASAA